MANTKSIQLLGLKLHFLENSLSKFSINALFDENYFSVILVKTGSVNLRIMDEKLVLVAREAIIIPQKTYWQVVRIKKLSEICVVSFTSDFAHKNSLRKLHTGYFELYTTKYPSKISVKGKDLPELTDLFKLLFRKAKQYNKLAFKEEIILLAYNLLLYVLVENYYRLYKELRDDHTLKEKTLLQFFRILELNYKKQHGVKFYAQVLCMTPDHLTKIVKEATQKTTKEFIIEAIIVESKQLLQNKNLTINKISEELEFDSPSIFCNFFKKHTLLSPGAYRLTLNS